MNIPKKGTGPRQGPEPERSLEDHPTSITLPRTPVTVGSNSAKTDYPKPPASEAEVRAQLRRLWQSGVGIDSETVHRRMVELARSLTGSGVRHA